MKNDLNYNITALVNYGLKTKLIAQDDVTYIINRLLCLFKSDEYVKPNQEVLEDNIDDILSSLIDYAYSQGILKENTPVYRDIFDTEIMSILTPLPSTINKRFYLLQKKSPNSATSYFYNLCVSSNYIRSNRIKKDLRWKTNTKYGLLDVTINLSKPEKDPKAIALAKTMKQSSYPKCQLCYENVGYLGRVNHPARGNLRAIPIVLEGEKYYFQYSPYSYYNEHCIVFNSEHIPMKVDINCFKHLVSFVSLFPHYMLGSNADLPIVGGSILTHDHYQGGKYTFPMFKAKKLFDLDIKGFNSVSFSYLKWPLSTIRLESKNKKQIVLAADKILNCWRNYTSEENYIYSVTDSVLHNTITPICHKDKNGNFVLDLILRNNITSEEYPLGYYHPHSECWNIKKENIGLIEAMGLAVLPSRLKSEIEEVKKAVLEKRDFSQDEKISKHYEWFLSFKDKYDFNESNIDVIFEKEIGLVFLKVLEYAGVFKQNDKGNKGILKFVDFINRR